jgi:hypothetical protein
LGDVLHIGEVRIPLFGASGATEIVDSNRTVTLGGKATGKVFVELEETPDIGENDYRDSSRLCRLCSKSVESVPVSGLEHETLRSRSLRTGREGGKLCIMIHTHGAIIAGTQRSRH